MVVRAALKRCRLGVQHSSYRRQQFSGKNDVFAAAFPRSPSAASRLRDSVAALAHGTSFLHVSPFHSPLTGGGAMSGAAYHDRLHGHSGPNCHIAADVFALLSTAVCGLGSVIANGSLRSHFQRYRRGAIFASLPSP